MKGKILLIEVCNYLDYPIGGYLSFAKQMIHSFHTDELALVGMATDDETIIGKWSKKTINGVTYDFFAVKNETKISKKRIMPARLASYLAVRKYRKEILSIGIKNVFIQTPESLFAMKLDASYNLCCRVPGLENPLENSRYSYSKYFASLFQSLYFKALSKANIILATGDDKAILNYIKKSSGKLSKDKIVKFPSRINTTIFNLDDKVKARNSLAYNADTIHIVTTGRLSELKGWKFMLDCFLLFKENCVKAHFTFLGDGEDREKINQYIRANQLENHVTITGRVNHNELAVYLNASDIYIMGSYVEGWSTSLVEAIACGLPVVCTDFSSAKELIDPSVNGFVIGNRSIEDFVMAMRNCVQLNQLDLKNKAIEMKNYGTNRLKESMLKEWKL